MLGPAGRRRRMGLGAIRAGPDRQGDDREPSGNEHGCTTRQAVVAKCRDGRRPQRAHQQGENDGPTASIRPQPSKDPTQSAVRFTPRTKTNANVRTSETAAPATPMQAIQPSLATTTFPAAVDVLAVALALPKRYGLPIRGHEHKSEHMAFQMPYAGPHDCGSRSRVGRHRIGSRIAPLGLLPGGLDAAARARRAPRRPDVRTARADDRCELKPLNYVGTLRTARHKGDPFQRLTRTAKAFETIFFGSKAEADQILARVRRMHARVHTASSTSLPASTTRPARGTTPSTRP